jgi:hypothetical protein
MHRSSVIPVSAFGALLLALNACFADTWTNQAGQALSATLLAFEGGFVTLQTTNGATLRMPLSALCDADQGRVRARHGESPAPAFVQTAYRDARAVLARYGRLPAARRTVEGERGARRMALALFDARVNAGGATNLDAAVRAELVRMRGQLAGR